MKISDFIQRGIEYVPFLKKWDILWIKRTILGVCILLFLIIIFSFLNTGGGSESGQWASVIKGPFYLELIESGEVEAVSQRLINAPMVYGTQLQVVDLIPEGTIVKKGDFLLQFDARDLQESMSLAEDQLASLRADMKKLHAQQSLTMQNLGNSLKLSQYSWEQAQIRLEMRKFESEARQEEARLELIQAEISLKKVRKQIESQKIIHASDIIKKQTAIKEAENNLRSIKERIDKLTLLAPLDGMVVYQEVGSWNSRERLKTGYNARRGRSLMSIPDLSKMRVKIYINEVDRLKINIGQEVIISLDAYPKKEYRGRVTEVSRLAQLVTDEERLKGFVVYANIDGTDTNLKPGMTAKVRIIINRLDDVMSVPMGAVFEIEGQPVVFPKGSSKPLAVYLGVRNDGYVVINQGVKPNMQLSWSSVSTNASPLGTSEERRKINELSKTIENSFQIFRERGILYEYEKSIDEDVLEKEGDKPRIDIEKLSPSLKNRLKRRENTTSDSNQD